MVKKSFSTADPGQVLKDAHNYRDHGLRVFIANSDIPVEATSKDYLYIKIKGETVVSQIDFLIGGQREVTSIHAVADIAGSLGGLHFFLSSPSDNYYVWLDVDNGSSDPSIGGRTSIEVNISSGDNRDTVATAIKTSLDLNEDFLTVISTHRLIVTNKRLGSVTDFSAETSTMLGGIITQGENRILKASKLFTYDNVPNIINEETVYNTVDEF